MRAFFLLFVALSALWLSGLAYFLWSATSGSVGGSGSGYYYAALMENVGGARSRHVAADAGGAPARSSAARNADDGAAMVAAATSATSATSAAAASAAAGDASADDDSMPSLISDELDRLDVELADARRAEEQHLALIEREKAAAARAAIRKFDVQIEQLLFLRQLVRHGASDATAARSVAAHPTCDERCALPCAHALLAAGADSSQCQATVARCHRVCHRRRIDANVLVDGVVGVGGVATLAGGAPALSASRDAVRQLRDDRLARDVDAALVGALPLAAASEAAVVLALPSAWRTAASERRAACPLTLTLVDADDAVAAARADVYASRSIDRRDECLGNATAALCALLVPDSGRLTDQVASGGAAARRRLADELGAQRGIASIDMKLAKSLDIEDEVTRTISLLTNAH